MSIARWSQNIDIYIVIIDVAEATYIGLPLSVS